VIFYPDYFLLFYPFIAFPSFYRDFLISGIITMDDIHLKPGVKKEAVERQPVMSRRFHSVQPPPQREEVQDELRLRHDDLLRGDAVMKRDSQVMA
jgi:hypothetical protein